MFKTSEECTIHLIGHSNVGDFMPCSAARVSFGNEDKTGKDEAKDIKLMRFLADNKHMTPFEYQHATFLIECPLFIRSQIHRHRSFSYNEISRRYTDENLEFWVPTEWRGQATSNRQASEGVVDFPIDRYRRSCYESLSDYEEMLEAGIAREQARAILPQSLLTKFYMGGNLRNWAHFIELRIEEHAQREIQIVANRVAGELIKLWPASCEALGI